MASLQQLAELAPHVTPALTGIPANLLGNKTDFQVNHYIKNCQNVDNKLG